MRTLKVSVVVLIACLIAGVSHAQSSEPEAPRQTLIKNVNVFDGKTDGLARGQEVLVEGNMIKAVGRSLSAGSGATVIDGGGRTLMPGR